MSSSINMFLILTNINSWILNGHKNKYINIWQNVTESNSVIRNMNYERKEALHLKLHVIVTRSELPDVQSSWHHMKHSDHLIHLSPFFHPGRTFHHNMDTRHLHCCRHRLLRLRRNVTVFFSWRFWRILSLLPLLLAVADFLTSFRLDLMSFLILLNAVLRSFAGDVTSYWLTFNPYLSFWKPPLV